MRAVRRGQTSCVDVQILVRVSTKQIELPPVTPRHVTTIRRMISRHMSCRVMSRHSACSCILRHPPSCTRSLCLRRCGVSSGDESCVCVTVHSVGEIGGLAFDPCPSSSLQISCALRLVVLRHKPTLCAVTPATLVSWSARILLLELKIPIDERICRTNHTSSGARMDGGKEVKEVCRVMKNDVASCVPLRMCTQSSVPCVLPHRPS